MGTGSNGEGIDCSADAQAKYLEDARISATMFTVVRKLAGQQRRYYCRVQEFYNDNPQAVFLARTGMRVVRVGNTLLSPLAGCATLTNEINELETDIIRLQATSASPELDTLLTDVRDLKARGCDGMVTIANDGTMQSKLYRDIRAYVRAVEQAQPGSTTGFSGILQGMRWN